MSTHQQADFIIVGGGTAGCVLASRISKANPAISVLLIEAGKDVTNREHISKPLESVFLHGSEMDYAYTTTPQTSLDGKTRYNCGARALSGGTAMNSGGWTRGDAADYDQWAVVAGDKRWSYAGFLPYFKKTERHFDRNADTSIHGLDGPIHIESVSSSGRKYPLREPVKEAWAEVGLPHVADANSGHPRGLAELTENRRDGLRQLASTAYPLDKVEVLTEAIVQRVIFDTSGQVKATGIELTDGRTFTARNQVILACGAYRTPQVLMLSGIGPASHLKEFDIPQVAESPNVGQNLHDHMMVSRYWKLRHPEEGLAFGTPKWSDPSYQKGIPMDWIATDTLPPAEADPNDPARCHLEMYVVYAAFRGDKVGLNIPVDGSHIMTSAIGMLPTSRGSIRLASKDAAANPVVDPNYYATAFDRRVQRIGQAKLSQLLLETKQGKQIVECEVAPPGLSPLLPTASQEEVDARVKISGQTLYHPAGTAAMGTVVDADLNVKGVRGLKLVDASVIPVPLACHYQAAVYALAEQASDMILSECRQ